MAVVYGNAANIFAALRILEKKHGVSSLRCLGHMLPDASKNILRKVSWPPIR